MGWLKALFRRREPDPRRDLFWVMCHPTPEQKARLFAELGLELQDRRPAPAGWETLENVR